MRLSLFQQVALFSAPVISSKIRLHCRYVDDVVICVMLNLQSLGINAWGMTSSTANEVMVLDMYWPKLSSKLMWWSCCVPKEYPKFGQMGWFPRKVSLFLTLVPCSELAMVCYTATCVWLVWLIKGFTSWEEIIENGHISSLVQREMM